MSNEQTMFNISCEKTYLWTGPCTIQANGHRELYIQVANDQSDCNETIAFKLKKNATLPLTHLSKDRKIFGWTHSNQCVEVIII